MRKKMRNRGFSLIELLVVIVLIAIISIIAFVNFGNQSSKARNAMRLDNSGKILKAFQLQQLEEKIPSNECLAGSSDYSLTGTLSGTGCNVILDGSSDSKSFLSKLKISGNFQDPLNKVEKGDSFIYEFNYKLGGNQYEFAYLMEPKEKGSLINLNKTYALEYQSGSLNSINIDGNFTSVDNIITPVILKDSNGNRLFSSLYSTGLFNGKEKITRFNKSTELKESITSILNSKNSLSDVSSLPEESSFTKESCFVFDESTGTITGYKFEDCGPVVNIPPTINKVPVVAIGDMAFLGLTGITALTIPEGVTSIGNNAFNHLSLTELIIPNSVTTIGAQSFYNNQLRNLTLGTGLQTIGKNSFAMNKLTNVLIPNSVHSILEGAFSFNLLTSVDIGTSVTNLGALAFGQQESYSSGSVYGPSSGYVYEVYYQNYEFSSQSPFDKSILTNYLAKY